MTDLHMGSVIYQPTDEHIINWLVKYIDIHVITVVTPTGYRYDHYDGYLNEKFKNLISNDQYISKNSAPAITMIKKIYNKNNIANNDKLSLLHALFILYNSGIFHL